MTEEQVLAFVRRSLRSAWALELLLILQRDAAVAWSTEALVRELRGSPGLVAQSLAMLTDAGLAAATETDAYVYRPQTPELAESVAALARLYAAKPATVLRTIFTSPDDRIRSFADAFLFKK